MTTQAIRFVASSSKSTIGSIFLNCHVKPGSSKQREGIIDVHNDSIILCVAAQAREGEANKAVQSVFSSILRIPKGDVEIVRGAKSREKVVKVSGIDAKEGVENCIQVIREQLQKSTS